MSVLFSVLFLAILVTFPMSNVAPFGLSIALWSWDYDPLFVALWRDHDPCYRLLQTLMGTDHIRPVSLSKVRSDPHPPRFHEHL